jgi:hypothetical protein
LRLSTSRDVEAGWRAGCVYVTSILTTPMLSALKTALGFDTLELVQATHAPNSARESNIQQRSPRIIVSACFCFRPDRGCLHRTPAYLLASSSLLYNSATSLSKMPWGNWKGPRCDSRRCVGIGW